MFSRHLILFQNIFIISNFDFLPIFWFLISFLDFIAWFLSFFFLQNFRFILIFFFFRSYLNLNISIFSKLFQFLIEFRSSSTFTLIWQSVLCWTFFFQNSILLRPPSKFSIVSAKFLHNFSSPTLNLTTILPSDTLQRTFVYSCVNILIEPSSYGFSMLGIWNEPILVQIPNTLVGGGFLLEVVFCWLEGWWLLLIDRWKILQEQLHMSWCPSWKKLFGFYTWMSNHGLLYSKYS